MALPVKARGVDGVWIRHAPGRSDLLGRSATPSDGRWQRASVSSPLYLADSVETATAEWYRSLAERGFYPEDYLPFDHHRWRVGLELADFSTRKRLDQFGLPAPTPDRRSWPAFQTVGEQLFTDGWPETARSECGPPGLADRVHLHGRAVAAARMYAGRSGSQRSGSPPPQGMTTWDRQLESQAPHLARSATAHSVHGASRRRVRARGSSRRRPATSGSAS